jgi:hypothetical protein
MSSLAIRALWTPVSQTHTAPLARAWFSLELYSEPHDVDSRILVVVGRRRRQCRNGGV